MFRAKTKAQALLEAVNALAAKSSISYLAPGSKARALVEAMASVVGSISIDVSDGILQTLLTNATGPTLDLLGEAYGVQRLQPVPARVETNDSNFKFYVRLGNFGDINGGNDIIIPPGTQIRTENDIAGIYFTTRNTVTLQAADNEVFFAADQVGSRQLATVSANVLTKHAFIGYTDSPLNSLLVTNAKGIAGRPRETDQSLRFRIKSHLTANSAGNLTAVRLAGLLVPGVADIRVIPGRAGLGTYDVVVFGISPVVPASLLQEVQGRIDGTTAVGNIGIAVSPRLVGVSMKVRVRFRPGTNSSEKNKTMAAAEDQIRVYINDLQPGQDLVINNLMNIIIQSSDNILDIGVPGTPFEELLIWKQNGPVATRFSRTLKLNYRIQPDEDLIVEPFIQNPILFVEG